MDEFPVLKVFFPFVRTGHNVATYTASYVPVLAQGMEKLDGASTSISFLPMSRPSSKVVSVLVLPSLLLSV